MTEARAVLTFFKTILATLYTVREYNILRSDDPTNPSRNLEFRNPSMYELCVVQKTDS